jgi:hypothetical protein
MRDGICAHCGGMIDEKGYAMGGEIDSGEFEMAPEYDRVEAEEREPTEDAATDQRSRTEWMRQGAFADAISRRGPVAHVEEMQKEPPPMRDEVAEMKRKRYGGR